MAHWRCVLTYDGTLFHGWQVQPGLRTIQGTLAEALARITGEAVLPQGSGRTDAGVHALGQVASFTLVTPIPAPNLFRALNRVLPASIRVLRLEEAGPEFHARHNAVRKTYEYRIFPARGFADEEEASERLCSPMLAPYVWACPKRLDRERLRRAARHVIGTHDFTSFSAADPERALRESEEEGTKHRGNIRTVEQSCWMERDGLLLYRVTGSGFLHHMVRNFVGTFVEAGAGRIDADAIPEILEARSRPAAGPTAPARGLFLVEVEY